MDYYDSDQSSNSSIAWDASPKKAPQPTIRRSSMTESLPPEIVLAILQALVTQAVEIADEMAMVLTYSDARHDSKLDILIHTRFAWQHDSTQMRRFRSIRAPLQINHHTRRLIHEHFVPFPMRTARPRSRHMGWVCPKLDLFYLNTDADEEQGNLKRAIESPTPLDARLVKSIEVVHDFPPYFFGEGWVPELETVYALPNLREINLNIGYTGDEFEPVPVPKKLHSHADLLPIDADLFPELALYFNDDEPNENYAIWAEKARARGIKIFCIDPRFFWFWKTIELIQTPAGTRMKFVHPECRCYKGSPCALDDSGNSSLSSGWYDSS
ncbi:hypothetical protein K4K54_001148 [Colletotrichum sp. SAR 10_86]|nr:hypothetical protein K4K51_010165 [Colletotrichum sp. SAR 10_75]KAI8229937.1 hypothetical protein K4K54_001148 [Colletotrichum sp. SAR 10_86]